MPDILSMSNTDFMKYKKQPQLVITIISRYRCKRCKQEFTKVVSRAANPKSENDKNNACYNITEVLKEISANRDTQLHFCSHTSNDGKFDRQKDVTDFIKYKIENGESIEVGPADYLGSNIIKDKRSVDIEEQPAVSTETNGFTYKSNQTLEKGE